MTSAAMGTTFAEIAFAFRRRDWKIVGVFNAGGSGFESEILAGGLAVGMQR